MMSPFPPSGRALKMGRMACVMFMRPVTLVDIIVVMSEGWMEGAWAVPLTRPLEAEDGC